MNPNEVDLYELLETKPDATIDEIRASYRKLARKFHPDLNPGNKEAEQKFKEISYAYDLLIDEKKRKDYDEGRRNGTPPSWNDYAPVDIPDLVDLFGDVFANLFTASTARRPQQGTSLRIEISITKKEAQTGTKKRITFERLEACLYCKGSGSMPGAKMRKCSSCRGTGVVAKSLGFVGIEELCSICDGFGKLILSPCYHCKGKRIGRVNRQLEVTIPRGVTTGTRLRLRAQGEPLPDGTAPGDLFCDITVV